MKLSGGDRWKWSILSSILVLFTLVGGGQGAIRCFACSAVDSDDPCVTDPTQVTNPDLECAQEDGSDGWCHIQREEFIEIPGKITSFVRLCIKTKEPYPYSDEISGADKITYYRTCRTNRCNSGSGLDESSSGGAGTNLTGIIRVKSESFATSTFANFPLVSILAIAMTSMFAASF